MVTSLSATPKWFLPNGVISLGRPSPQAGNFYWHKQGQSGMRSWDPAQHIGVCICEAASFGRAPRAKHPANPAGRVVCAVQSVGLISMH